MIIYNYTDFRSFLDNELSVFKSIQSKLIIVDRYYGGSNDNHRNIDSFLKYIKRILPDTEIIWFYDGSRTSRRFNGEKIGVEDIDFGQDNINIHDRFLFVYDCENKIYVKLLHIGASINAYNLNTDDQGISVKFGVFRISQIDEIDLSYNENKNNKLLIQLEEMYTEKTKNRGWGC